MNDRAEARRLLSAEDVSYLVEQLRIFDRYPGVVPWNRAELWAAALDAQMNATTRAEREAVAEVRGALQVLDAIERFFVRREA
ncbi:hypothetical protein ACSRUE_17020 [Sorangium sp. KYC3313]|uniref:hypothetical protein n=1 Tax=Sorangium sp. KYC3313 TaxID=3449740 RepID=UPI003F8B5FCB